MVFIGNCKCVPYEYKSVCWGGGIDSDQMLEWRYNTLMHNTGTKSYFFRWWCMAHVPNDTQKVFCFSDSIQIFMKMFSSH